MLNPYPTQEDWKRELETLRATTMAYDRAWADHKSKDINHLLRGLRRGNVEKVHEFNTVVELLRYEPERLDADFVNDSPPLWLVSLR